MYYIIKSHTSHIEVNTLHGGIGLILNELDLSASKSGISASE